MDIVFRCYPGMEQILPKPVLSRREYPEWLKTMPVTARNEEFGVEVDTFKKCPPFVDAMGFGFVVPLPTDVHVDRCEFSWDWRELAEVESLNLVNDSFSPMSVRYNAEAAGTPLFDEDVSFVKFNNFWTFEVEAGHSILATHPVNRLDLPFRSLTGLVDADTYREGFVNFPAVWVDPEFVGTLKKGTPISQCFVVKREAYNLRCESIPLESLDDYMSIHDRIRAAPGFYRKTFRGAKR